MRFARVIFAILVLSGLGLMPTTAGAALPPPNMGGENLAILDGIFDPGPTGVQAPGTLTITGTCNDSGPSTFNFYGSGTVSTAPYPGPFEVSGSFTLSTPESSTGDNLIAFSENFTIHSPNGLVTGTKELDTTDQFPYYVPGGVITQNVAECTNHLALDGQGDSTRAALSALTLYTATIQTSDGTFQDHGRTLTSLGEYREGPDATPVGAFLHEFFVSDLSISPPPPSTTPVSVTLTPPDAVNPVSSNHTVTAMANDVSGTPVANASILFSVRGSTNISGSCVTDATGICSFTYQGPDLPGADLITGCADNNNNGAADVGEPCGTATKAWVLPAATTGQVTGGGQIYNSSHSDKIAFGFTGKSDTNGIKGECSVVDPSTKTKIKCTDVTDLVRTATHATLFGDATVNGTATTYRIDVDDNAEPGAGSDTFKIHTASGYTTGGVLTNGNIQIHS